MNLKISTITAVLALSLICAGCTSATEAVGEGTTGEVLPAANADPLAIAKIEEFASPNLVAEQARQIIVSECMSAAGHSWEYQEPLSLKIDDLMVGRPLSIEDARTYGYSSPVQKAEQSVPAGGEGAQQAFIGNPESESTTIDLFGSSVSVANDGCLGQSLEVLYGSIERGMRATGAIQNALLPSMNAVNFDSTVTGLFPEWSDCMSDAGYDVPNPDQAWLQAQSDPAVGSAIAIEDAKCRESVSYDSTRREVASKYLTSFLQENEALITEVQVIRTEGATKAQQVLSDQ